MVTHNDCILVRWQVENVKAVELNYVGVVGMGEQAVCGAYPRLEITLPDDSRVDYDFPRHVLLHDKHFYVALFGVPLTLSLIGIFSGIGKRQLQALWRGLLWSATSLGRSALLARVTYLLAAALLSGVVLAIFFAVSNDAHQFHPEILSGDFQKPYLYRTLAPTTVRTVAALLPNEIALAVARLPIIEPTLTTSYEWQPERASLYLVNLAMHYGALLLFAPAMASFLSAFFGQVTSAVLSLLALALLPYLFHYYTWVYDFPNLALFTFALGLLVRARWRLFIPVYVLACLSKETASLLTIVYFFYYFRRLTWRRYLSLFVLQVLIFAGIRLMLVYLLRDMPGSFFYFTIDENLAIFREQWSSLTGLACLGMIGLMSLLLLLHWRAKPAFLRAGISIGVVLGIMGVLVGIITEWRIYYEFYPVGFALCACSLKTELVSPPKASLTAPSSPI